MIRNLLRRPMLEFGRYWLVKADPAIGILYVTKNSPQFLSGHLRLRGKAGGAYPYNYIEMIDQLFGPDHNTVEVCAGTVRPGFGLYTVDIHGATKPCLVDNGETLRHVKDWTFTRWRCDPPYNDSTASRMYRTALPKTGKLLAAGARVCKPGSLLFILLGPQNYQISPPGCKRIGWIAITIVPNNELRTLTIFYKKPG